MNKSIFKKLTIKGVGLLLIGGLIGGVLGSGTGINGEALFGLLGVVVGAFIPSVFQDWASRLDRKNQLRVAAIDKRLEVHQEAYSLWIELASKAHKREEIGEYVVECQKWWNNNCLYLAPKAREAFRYAYACAHNHQNFLDERKHIVREFGEDKQRLDELIKMINQNWDNISAAGQAIVEGVELPTIGEDEFKEFELK